MSYRLEDIVFEMGKHWVLSVPNGYEVYRIGITHSTRVARIGRDSDTFNGRARAIAECERREASPTPR